MFYRDHTATITLAPAVKIDIEPRSEGNLIYPLSRLLIPVALLGSDSFDVADVDVTTLAFGADGAAPAFDLTNPWVYLLSHWGFELYDTADCAGSPVYTRPRKATRKRPPRSISAK